MIIIVNVVNFEGKMGILSAWVSCWTWTGECLKRVIWTGATGGGYGGGADCDFRQRVIPTAGDWWRRRLMP